MRIQDVVGEDANNGEKKENVISPVDRIKNLPVSMLEKLQEFMDGLEKE